MKLVLKGFLLVCLVVCFQQNAVSQQTEVDNWDSEIRKSISNFVDAFNRGDAAAVTSQWTEDAEYITPDGEKFVGRKAIHDLYTQVFADTKGLRLSVEDLSIHLEGPGVAIEQGTAKVSREADVPEWTHYTARHVEENGAWKIASVHEAHASPDAPSQYEHLKELEWMVGEWIDQSEDAAIETTCRWSKNQNFLTRYFMVRLHGQVEHEGMQIIGYDAATGKIQSWVFDSDGGTGSGVWTRDGNTWSVAASHSMPDGSKGKATNIFTLTDDGHFTWQSVNRTIGGESIPDVPEIIVTKKQ